MTRSKIETLLSDFGTATGALQEAKLQFQAAEMKHTAALQKWHSLWWQVQEQLRASATAPPDPAPAEDPAR